MDDCWVAHNTVDCQSALLDLGRLSCLSVIIQVDELLRRPNDGSQCTYKEYHTCCTKFKTVVHIICTPPVQRCNADEVVRELLRCLRTINELGMVLCTLPPTSLKPHHTPYHARVRQTVGLRVCLGGLSAKHLPHAEH